MRVKICDKQCNFTLLLGKTRGLTIKTKQLSLCSKHIICLLWTLETVHHSI